MTTLNISNPTGTKRNWMLSLTDGKVLAKGITSWTQAVDAAKTVAPEHGVTDILLHKINGTVQNIPMGRKAASAPQMVIEGDVVFVARVSKSIDHDPDKSVTTDSLEAAIKSLPRKAQKLVWNVNPFDSHTLDDGRIVSVERTTN
jgi:hypothetical protein